MKSGSRLERVLHAGHFAVTAECGPPKGSDVAKLEAKAKHLQGKVDAVNVTDNQTAIVRMSSVAACSLLKNIGLGQESNRIAERSFWSLCAGDTECPLSDG